MRLPFFLLLTSQITTLYGQQQQFPPGQQQRPQQQNFDTRQQNFDTRQQDFSTNSRLETNYLVLASKIIRPGTVFKVVTSMLKPFTSTEVIASISRNGVEVAGGRLTIEGGNTDVILLKIPQTSVQGDYKLKVEGLSNDILGKSFEQTTELVFSPRFLTILIQTSRPVYNADQHVQIRAVVLTMDLKPYAEPVTINILDPDGFMMANFRSVQLNVGVGRVDYYIPSLPVVGFWTVEVVAYGQTEQRQIHVEKGYYCKVEVDTWMNEFVLASDEFLTGEVEAAYLTNSALLANMTMQVLAFPPGASIQGETGAQSTIVYEEVVESFKDSYEFEFPLDEIRQRTKLVDGTVLRMVAHVHDKLLDNKEITWSSSMVVEGKVAITFLGATTKVFKPGMPYRVYMAVSYSDSAPLEPVKLENAYVEIQAVMRLATGATINLPTIRPKIGENGILKFTVETQPNAASISFRAKYSDEDGDDANAEMIALASISTRNRILYVYVTAPNANIDEYVVVHVRANFYMKSFNYLVISKGIIIHAGTEELELLLEPIKTFSFAVGADMAPTFHILVYHVTPDGYLVSDIIAVPVNNLNRNKVNLYLNFQKDKSGNTVEFGVVMEPGMFYGTHVEDSMTFCHKCGGDITKAYVLESMHSFDGAWDVMNKIKWYPRERKPDDVAVFETSNSGIDAEDTLIQSQLISITDVHLTAFPDNCNRTLGYRSCKNGRCYLAYKHCDGRRDCDNGFDEIGCPTQYTQRSEIIRKFRVFRRSRNEQYYDTMEGDWGWLEINTDDDDFRIAEIPNRPSMWTVTAWGVHPRHGLGLLENAIEITGTRPFYITVEMPTFCRRGEQVSIRADVFNLLGFGIYVTIVLPASDDYKFVHVEEHGKVHSYAPRTSFGEHHHHFYMEPDTQTNVYLPIVPTRVGEIEVTLEAWTNIAKDSGTFTLKVIPDGAQQGLHTSLLLDLKVHPIVLKFLNITTLETPIVSYDRWRRYIYESPAVKVSVSGDVFGPAFPTVPVTTESLLLKPDRSAEAMAFTFGANVWTLHYLRLTNQLQKSVKRETFKHLRFYYAMVMSFRNRDGSFSMWVGMEPSVWLTAQVARVLQDGRFPDWENEFFIDSKILDGAIKWLMTRQTPYGSFEETSRVPLNSRMNTMFRTPQEQQARLNNIPLTAHVLITLCTVNDLEGEVKVKASSAKSRAMRFLESRINEAAKDPFDMAIVTYALTLAGSVEADAAFVKLDSLKREQEGHCYWADEQVPFTNQIYQTEKYYVQPRYPFRRDAQNVEATSYALLVYIIKEGIPQTQENIVRWLNTMRVTEGGFISTQDTLIAMQALAEFSFRARLRDVTDMNVRVEFSSANETSENIHINEDNLATLQSVEAPHNKVWGYVNVEAHGSGMSLLQLDLTYSVDHTPLLIPPPQRAFDLEVKARYHGRNSSFITIEACQRWILTKEAPASGVAVFEMDVPTGYSQYKTLLYRLVDSRRVPNLRRMYLTDEKFYAFFDSLDERRTCIDFTLHRWFPVANMSQYLKAKVFDYYAPERYNETLFHTYNLYLLDVCMVCGSYQCPYCYFYSSAMFTKPSFLVFLMCLVVGSWNVFYSFASKIIVHF